MRSNPFASNSVSNWEKSFTETFEMLLQAYEEVCWSRAKCHEWYICIYIELYPTFVWGMNKKNEWMKNNNYEWRLWKNTNKKFVTYIKTKCIHCLCLKSEYKFYLRTSNLLTEIRSFKSCNMKGGSVVAIVTKLRNRDSEVRTPAGEIFFYFLQNVQTSSGALPGSWTRRNRVPFWQ
jgi:hypothetical protein